MHTPNITAENVEKLAALFPNCVTETKDENTGQLKRAIDFDQLRQELSDHIVDGPRERYHLDWPGKREALVAANAPIAKTLRPCREESVDFDTTMNLFIEGDNLDALKLLQETYLNRVQVIYIDPPYNTGSDLLYEDKFTVSSREHLLRSNQQDESGGKLVANRETNGRFHSDWLSMIYPRLRLCSGFLREDGIILISIDDTEVAGLRAICDEVFGAANFVAQLVWEKGRKNDAKLFSLGHDYIVVYAKSRHHLKETGVRWREVKAGAIQIQEEFLRLKKLNGQDNALIESGLREFYAGLPKGHPAKKLSRYNKVDDKGVWRDDNMSWPGGGGPRYEVLHPKTKLPCEVPEGGWRYSTITRMNQMIAAGRVLFREDHTEPPIRKTYLVRENEGDESEEFEGGEDVGIQVAGTYFYRSALQASNVIVELFGSKVFDSPKDHEVIARLLRYVTRGEQNAIVMDFFAGSGTIAHSVFHLNAEDGGHRRFIAVQIAQLLDPSDKDQRVAAEFCDSAGLKRTIADICKERIRLAGNIIKASNTDALLDIGFRVLKIDTSNMTNVYYAPDAVNQDQLALHADNIKEDRTPEDLLFQVLGDWGVDLALPITQETVAGKIVFFVDGNALAACFDTKISEDLVKELAKRKPLRAVFRDSSYDSDSTKINVDQIFKLLSPETEVKTL